MKNLISPFKPNMVETIVRFDPLAMQLVQLRCQVDKLAVAAVSESMSNFTMGIRPFADLKARTGEKLKGFMEHAVISTAYGGPQSSGLGAPRKLHGKLYELTRLHSDR